MEIRTTVEVSSDESASIGIPWRTPTPTLGELERDHGGLVFTVHIPRDENPDEILEVQVDLQHLADLPRETRVRIVIERHYSYDEAKHLGLRDPDWPDLPARTLGDDS